MMWYDPMDDYIDEVTSPPLDKETEKIIYELQKISALEESELYSDSLFRSNNKANVPTSQYTHTQKSYNTFYIKAVGVTYGNRQQNIRRLKNGDKLKLIHEKNNRYDNNALLITTDEGLEIGYVSKEINKDLLNKINNNLLKSVTVENVTGDAYSNKGVNIKIEVFKADETIKESYKELQKISAPNPVLKTEPQKNSTPNPEPKIEPVNDGIEDLPIGCWCIIALVIIILIIGFSGGVTSW